MTVATAPRRTRLTKAQLAITRDRYHRYTYQGVTYPGSPASSGSSTSRTP